MRILFAILISTQMHAQDCDCTTPPIEEEVKLTRYIVLAKVTRFLTSEEQEALNLRNNRSYLASAEVTQSFKGRIKVGEKFEIGSEYTSCDMLFKNGAGHTGFQRAVAEYFKGIYRDRTREVLDDRLLEC